MSWTCSSLQAKAKICWTSLGRVSNLALLTLISLCLGRCVYAGPVVVLGNLVEAHGQVLPRAPPFGGIDGAELQGAKNIADRQVDDSGAELGERLAAKAQECASSGL